MKLNKQSNSGCLASTGLRVHTREEVLIQLKSVANAYEEYQKLSKTIQEEMLLFCMGKTGLRITYDPFFKKIFNPETKPERLSSLLSALLQQKVTVKRALPNESDRLTAEGSFLVMVKRTSSFQSVSVRDFVQNQILLKATTDDRITVIAF